jgi:glucose-6-phosphate 1-dehydrogenase
LDNIEDSLVLGQYGPGVVEGKPVPGYRESPGVNPDSTTPTFVAMTGFVDNWRWQGVPFYIMSGKALAEKVTQIAVNFKPAPLTMFRGRLGDEVGGNKLILGIYPEEKISLAFETKNPGAKICLRSVTMDFNYYHNYSGPKLSAYGKALLDCMHGDRILFWRRDALELCWAYFTPILEEIENSPDKQQRLLRYDAGSWGPASAKRGRSWV